jgi:hypothetical protein
MSANTKREIRELSTDELELVSGGNRNFVGLYSQWVSVAGDYYFNTDGGTIFHASQQQLQNMFGG